MHFSMISQCTLLNYCHRTSNLLNTQTPRHDAWLRPGPRHQVRAAADLRTIRPHIPRPPLAHPVLAPRWISPHLTLYAFPEAFLSRLGALYLEPYEARSYPAHARKQPEQQRRADISVQVVAFNTGIVLCPAVGAKIKRRL
jgi:hypothetical protein